MNDLLPLLEASSSSRTRALLQAGRVDAPPSGFSDRLLVGLGLGVAVTGVSGVAAASAAGVVTSGAAVTGSGATSLSLLAAKWVAVGVLGGGILAGGAELALSPGEPEGGKTSEVDPARSGSSPGPAEVPRPSPAAVVVPEAEPAPAVEQRQPQAGEGAASAPASQQPGQLGREVQAIDRARRALASGQPARALAELEGYERVAGSGVLDREAQILRIEALYKVGQAGRARLLVEQYRQAYPHDAHAARLRALEESQK